MNVYASNLKSAEAITLKHAHQQLAGMLSHGRFPSVLMSCASRTKAAGQRQACIEPGAYKVE